MQKYDKYYGGSLSLDPSVALGRKLFKELAWSFAWRSWSPPRLLLCSQMVMATLQHQPTSKSSSLLCLDRPFPGQGWEACALCSRSSWMTPAPRTKKRGLHRGTSLSRGSQGMRMARPTPPPHSDMKRMWLLRRLRRVEGLCSPPLVSAATQWDAQYEHNRKWLTGLSFCMTTSGFLLLSFVTRPSIQADLSSRKIMLVFKMLSTPLLWSVFHCHNKVFEAEDLIKVYFISSKFQRPILALTPSWWIDHGRSMEWRERWYGWWGTNQWRSKFPLPLSFLKSILFLYGC